MKMPEFEKKLPLIRRIFGRNAAQGDTPMNTDDTLPSPKDAPVQGLMGFSIFLVGVCGAVPLALVNMFSLDHETRAVSMVLMFMGLVFCHAGAGLVLHFLPQRRSRGQFLFFIAFVVSLGMAVTGLLRTFDEPGIALYLMVVGFFSSLVAVLAMQQKD